MNSSFYTIRMKKSCFFEFRTGYFDESRKPGPSRKASPWRKAAHACVRRMGAGRSIDFVSRGWRAPMRRILYAETEWRKPPLCRGSHWLVLCRQPLPPLIRPSLSRTTFQAILRHAGSRHVLGKAPQKSIRPVGSTIFRCYFQGKSIE